MMRLTLVISSLGRGGAERVMSILTSAWAEQGKQVTLLSFDHGESPAYALRPSVKVRSLGLLAISTNSFQALRRNAARIRVLRRAIRESDPDVVVSFLDRTNVLTLLATRGLGAPVMVSERSDPTGYDLGWAWNALRRFTYRAASALVCQTAATLGRFHEITQVNGYVIPIPIAVPNEFAGKAGLQPRSGERRRSSAGNRLIALGRLVQEKGFDILLDAFARLAPHHPDWSLVIAGEGPLRNELESQVGNLKLAGRVHFAGEVAHPLPLLCDADLFVLPSRVEGFPLALCEAMACGLPVVSFDCPSGPGDIIREGVDGLLAPPGDVAALAAALDRLMGDPGERQRLAVRAPEVLARFSRERILSLWQELFDRVLPGRGETIGTECSRPRDSKPEVKDSGIRFGFGRNWRRFLRYMDDERIAEAEKSLRAMLEIESLKGKSFLDAGCGSGLFSLAAMRLGAGRVHSFDYDPESVACARELKDRYFLEAGHWTLEQGDVLDQAYLTRLGQFDVVYSWGVLHHTGAIWRALGNVVPLVPLGGKLFISIYNDEGIRSRVWAKIKRTYSRWPVIRPLLIALFAAYLFLRNLLVDVAVQHKNPLARYRPHEKARGMAFWPDLLDWLGGYPFEVAKSGEILDFYQKKNFRLLHLKAGGPGPGHNEYVFIKSDE